jgi:hypothetical protein
MGGTSDWGLGLHCHNIYMWTFLNSPKNSTIIGENNESEGNCGPAPTLKTLIPTIPGAFLHLGLTMIHTLWATLLIGLIFCT